MAAVGDLGQKQGALFSLEEEVDGAPSFLSHKAESQQRWGERERKKDECRYWLPEGCKMVPKPLHGLSHKNQGRARSTSERGSLSSFVPSYSERARDTFMLS